MLIIKNHKQLMDSMALAKETGTEDQLIHWLLYLDSWHNKGKVEVHLYGDAIAADPGFICWSAYHITDDLQPGAFYNGGLVFHKSSKEWSIHS